MSNIKLVIDFDEIILTENYSCYGKVYWQCGNFSFPDAEWSDDVLDLLYQWTASLIRLILKTADEENFYFLRGLGGIVYLQIVAGEPLLDLFCRHELASCDPMHSCRVSLYNLTQQIYLASTRFISWHNDMKPIIRQIERESPVEAKERYQLPFEERIFTLKKHCEFIKNWKKETKR